MFELKERFSGRDAFKTILIFSCCSTAMRQFTLNFSRGGESKGPQTNLFSIQVAILSATREPNFKAEEAFLTKQGGRGAF